MSSFIAGHFDEVERAQSNSSNSGKVNSIGEWKSSKGRKKDIAPLSDFRH